MSAKAVALDVRLVSWQSTGDTTYWKGLLLGLSRISADFRFLLFSNAEKPPGIPDDPRFEWISLPSGSDRWWSLVQFPLAARKRGASAIHTQYNLSPLAGRAGITTIHDVSFFVEPAWFRPLDRAMLRRFVPASARRAARVITVSETSRRDVAKFISSVEGKIRVTPLAANPAIAAMERAQAKALVQKDFELGTPYCLTVGTRWPRKNMALAIEAMGFLDRSLPHRLVLTGKPGWGEEKSNERCVATGFVSEHHLSALYSAADLYLAPSHYEGFGITILEAFQCGCPVVCSNGGAQPEVAGDAAVTVQSSSSQEWARAIQGLLNDSSKLESLREAGRKRAANFRWEDTAALTVQVYKEVAG